MDVPEQVAYGRPFLYIKPAEVYSYVSYRDRTNG